ncbi:unnamed protein product, partial [Symbiodinium sp. KB8]
MGLEFWSRSLVALFPFAHRVPRESRQNFVWCGAASYDQCHITKGEAYFRKALGREPSLVQRLHLSVKESWASAASSTAMPWQ